MSRVMAEPVPATAPERPRTDVRRRRRAGWSDTIRVVTLMAVAAGFLGWLTARADVIFPDALRYIGQARALERGQWHDGLRRAVDHPLYPLGIAAVHRTLGRGDGPDDWQVSAQVASVAAGVLLVVPLYLVAGRLFGRSGAWLGCLLTLLTPVFSHVAADALSETTFLLFWTWGVWSALRFLEAGSLRWMGLALTFGGLAYLARPEGLLLPLAFVGALGLAPLVPAARMNARRWWGAVAVLALGAAGAVGPFVALKGGIGTKPAVARLLGLAPPSPGDAVERERPLEPGRSAATTGLLAARATFYAVRGAVTVPLLPLAALGLWTTVRRRWPSDARAWLFLGVVGVGSLLALTRLHATGGYCTPRHALLLSLPLFAAAATGLRTSAAWVGHRLRPVRVPRLGLLPGLMAVALVSVQLGPLVEPLNAGMAGYRDAGTWLAAHAPPGDNAVDVTGWSLYYADRPGYTFANLRDAQTDPTLRWVVVRDAHLVGPWGYCRDLRRLTAGAEVAARFPAVRTKGVTRVTVYQRQTPPQLTAAHPAKSPDIFRGPLKSDGRSADKE